MNDLARSFTVTRDAYDARADHRRRTIHMSMTQVSIERVVAGIKMCIVVPVTAYRAVTIRVRAPGGSATLTLSHIDHDLDVVLATGEAKEVAIAARAWAAVLEKTVVVEAGVVMLASHGRLAKPANTTRRSNFARRRKAGCVLSMTTVFRNEREIIARN